MVLHIMHSSDFFFSSHQKLSAELVLGRDAEQAERVPNRHSNFAVAVAAAQHGTRGQLK